MSKNITVNGTTYDASYVNAPLADGSGNATFKEEGELSLQSKSVTPTEAEQSVTSDPPYFGLSSVAVKAIPGTYVQPTATNAGGELAAGSTIAAGTYFSGEATVPSGGSNPIVLCDDTALQIISAGTTIGQDSEGKDVTFSYNGFLFRPTEGTDCLYIFDDTSGTPESTMSPMRILRMTLMRFSETSVVGAYIKSNTQSTVTNISMTAITIEGKTYYYVSNSLAVPSSAYDVYAIPYSAIGWG